MYVSFIGYIHDANPLVGLTWDNLWDNSKWAQDAQQDPSNGSLELWTAKSRKPNKIHIAVGVRYGNIEWLEACTVSLDTYEKVREIITR